MKSSELDKLKNYKKTLEESIEISNIENKESEKSNERQYENKIDSRIINNTWQKHLKNDCVNFNLKFNKFFKYKYDKKKKEVAIDKDFKDRRIAYYNDISKYILNRVKNIDTCLSSIGYKKIDNVFSRQLNTRMVIGLGEVSAREVSMKLDHIYGIPYIPATTLKGGYRNFMEKEYQFYQEGKEYKDLISKLFGTEDNEGGLIFIDTYPDQGFEIEKDIMNPHYSDYYTDDNNTTPPTDDQDPKPIFFITLKKAKFKFNIFIQKKLCSSETVDLIKDSFELFLNNEALGAKKAVGYGYFKAKEE